MTNRELIVHLSILPMDAIVKTSNSDGCAECNPEGMPNYHDIDDIPVFKVRGDYPYENEKNIIVL